MTFTLSIDGKETDKWEQEEPISSLWGTEYDIDPEVEESEYCQRHQMI